MSRPFQAYLIKLADADQPGQYTTKMGCSCIGIAINNVAASFESIGDALRSLVHNPASLTVKGDGMFTDPAGEAEIHALAHSGAPAKCELLFDGGLRVRAEFLITLLEFDKVVNDQRTWTIVIESIGGCHVE